MAKTLISFLLLSWHFFSYSQTVQMQNGIIMNPQDAKSQKIMDDIQLPGTDAERIPFERIRGSRFWNENWRNAELETMQGKVLKAPVRLNLATGEVHFMLNQQELVLSETPLRKILFTDDSTVFLANVPNLLLNNKELTGFVQVLVQGSYKLLKYTQRKLHSADSLFGTQKRFFFQDEHCYFIKKGDIIQRIKKLSKDNILKFLPSSRSYEEWIEKNHIDWKKEADVISFFRHYNSTIQQKENTQ